ncbi:2-hydroxy-3-oxopropionate reductase [Loigolactobacillus coryniformis subsp. coryniformis]|jgi:2-hydroxy-3-oxopropionate reductase|uniref:2-hydroxy-3-oxopropionate reductase n=1 Tax=Loigolactobacillus coryniformis subsp. coryniformis KCTC 3167 = DSM 20001 TaxID=913848 RepID=A0A0R1F4L1_9LACO|nr:2-hydroxy-3-oxopropionate reductase [Loigolactobacillus coryniformis]ATO54380.1 2-hydroxy-3-oxopropionate reductase [Loigolactobacillus coryniformis subsp. coryniformis KCTC 3167 = DSM 20001]KRK13978.1 2-hydroxy-3-oxopropionate reductase [Loigolactobacillus coryniformis subsp. coryniformis KCTC 3167 = DSM 20001]OEH91043.1 2-hydroxy-3-oxopropionate reductase [Loigolactobacillus coryniformis subsp. coryniformis]RRG00811.1 MAG: 2-hydroxy-3-oxopropionate reductase [Lactobacillus sp.]
MQKIGFIGLGIMGRPMARNLIEAGFSVSVFDINTTAVDSLVADGATASTAAEMAKSVDFIITMLPAAKHVRSVLEGTDGVFANAHSGLVVIDMSSIGPTDAQAFAEEAKKYQIATLDAPVSGGEPGAIAGTLSIMVGGEQETFKQSLPVFQGVGKDVVLVGGHGSGVTAKLANQVIVNLNIAAMSEALVLAAKAGIDIEKMYHAIRGGLAGSSVLDAKVPLILDRNFKPGGTIAINMKDLTNVMQTAHDLDVPLPLSSQLLEIFHALKADGKVMNDHGGIVQYYEKIANVEVNRGDDNE